MADDERSAEARAIAERALGRLLVASAPTSAQLIVLGGLVPPTLARTGVPEPPAHLGTTDVDVLLVTHHILRVPEGDLHVQIAGLAGYLLSKSAAARTRGADKDYYDLAYVLLYNVAGGPTEAANIVKASQLADVLPGMSSTFVEIRERFRDDRANGARAHAREALKVTPDDDQLILAADAAAAVNEFLAALGQ